MIEELTEDQLIARARSRKLAAALREAPVVAEHLRRRLHHSDGRTERGDDIPEAQTPLLSWIADDADALYVAIVEWVRAWSAVIGAPAPTSAVVAWRRYHLFEDGTRGSNVLGFPAWATPKDAHDLVAQSTDWLARHAAEIERDEDAAVYQDDLADKVWRLRAGYGLLEARPVREGTPRRCPACGEVAVQAEFFRGSLTAAELRGEDLISEASGIEVRCSACGRVSATRPGEVMRWLMGKASKADRSARMDEQALITAPAWTPAQAAFMLRRSRQVVNRWIADGELAVMKVGGKRYVRPENAQAVSERHRR